MGNHNILITNPKGESRQQFVEDVTRDQCKEWLDEFGPPPIGWFYQIVNHNKNVRKHPEYILIQGFKEEDGKIVLVDQRKARVMHNNGRWYTPRMAKRDARVQGAEWFTREKIWNGDDK